MNERQDEPATKPAGEASEGWKLLKDSTQDERSWPEDYAGENGQYFNTCHNCLRIFLGRRGTCKVCALSSTPAAPAETDKETK